MTLTAPPRPLEGLVSWNINTACNYRCSYCTQRFKEDRGRWSRDTPAFLAAFARLPGPWEVKLSGGEPFVHPTLTEIVSGLAALNFRVSVVTNFSASKEKLEAFVDAARGRAGVFSCSLHLEYVDDLPAFVEKAQWMSRLLAKRADANVPKPHLCVTTVATREVLPRLPALAASFAEAGVSFKIQPEKQDRDVIAYTEDETAQLVSLGGHNRTGVIAHVFRGRPCWSGARYFILDDKGEAYRCYPARRYKRERLGNFLSPDFRLASEASECLYDYCNCTVPIARGMMATRPEDAVAREENP